MNQPPAESLRLHGAPDALRTCPLVACVPVRDEAERIGRTLVALDAELRSGDGVVLVANDCMDETVPTALAILSAWDRPWALAECRWGERASAPLSRRLALDLADSHAPDAILLSLDADTLVLPGLREAYAAEFAAGFDLVCGRIGFIAEEAALLPAPDPANEAAIREYREASRHLAALIRPDPDNPWPHHGNIGGANFAVRGAAYRAVGGLPTPPSGEDRALRRRFEAADFRIRYANGPCVATSPRLDGRARGGLSDELRRNRFETDPVVDELLEPPDTLVLRCRSRAAFLDGGEDARVDLLKTLDLGAEDAARLARTGGEAAWQEAEDVSPRLARRRLRLRDIHRHLPDLRRTLATVRDARSDSPPCRRA